MPKPYWHATKDHDMVQNYAAFLAPFPKNKSLDILDFGRGPGRDVKYFQSLGHRSVGLDGSEVFCSMARQYTGCQILHQKFPSQELPRVLYDLYTTLRPGGILFLSNPRGNDEGWSGQRYGYYIQFDASKKFLEEAGFEVIDYYYWPLVLLCQIIRKPVIPAGKRVSSTMDGKLNPSMEPGFRQSLPE